MTKRHLVIGILAAAAAAFPAAPASGQEREDTVVLRDGNRVTGKISEYDFHGLKITPKGSGSQSIKSADIKSVSFVGQSKAYRDAESAFQSGQDDAAISKFADVIKNTKVKAEKQEAYWLTAQANFRANKVDEGVAAVKAMIGEFPLSRYVMTAATEVSTRLAAAGKPDDAVAYLDAEAGRLAKSPDAGTLAEIVKMMKAEVLIEKGDLSAKTDVENVSRGSGPAAAYAKSLRGDILLKGGDAPGAEKSYREAIAGGAPSAAKVKAYNGLGKILFDKGFAEKKPDVLKQALLNFLRGVVQFPPAEGESATGHETAIFSAGACFQAIGDLEKPGDAQNRAYSRARELFRRLRETYETSRFADEAKTRLERLGG